MAELNKEFVVDLKGKEFVTFNGLMDLAHQMKLKSITTELIQVPNEDNGNQCIMKAVATTEDGKVFEGYGDADPTNVNRMIARHLIRMAETRAKARALRDLTNVGMTAIEELGGDEEPKEDKRGNVKDAKRRQLVELAKMKNQTNAMPEIIKEKYKKESSGELTIKELDGLIDYLKEL